MTAILAWLVAVIWPAIWGNLLAGVLQVAGTAGIVHALHRRHAHRRDRVLHARLDRLHVKLDELVRASVTSSTATPPAAE